MSWKQTTQLWASWTTTIAALITFLLLSYIIPEFQELFTGFGAELPLFTRLILSIHEYFYLLALPGFIGNLLIYNFKHTIGWWLVGFSAIMGIVMIPLTTIAMYLPIFEMGSVVNGQ
jgi:hypothetical protein